MTGRGIAFILFFALMLLAGLATGISEIFVMVFLSGMILVFALVSVAVGVFALSAKPLMSQKEIVRGKCIRLDICLFGFLLLPVIVCMKIAVTGEAAVDCADMVWGRGRRMTFNRLQCPHRGIWQLGILQVRCRDVFGLFSLPLGLHRQYKRTYPLTVYPVLYEISEHPKPPAINMEYTQTNLSTADQGDSFADTRLYRHGDPLKRIHWKQSVRTRELHTRQYEQPMERMAVIVVDTCALEGEAGQSLFNYADMACECAAALALLYLESGYMVRVCVAGCADGDLVVHTPEDFEEVYSLLATAVFGGDRQVTQTVAELVDRELAQIGALHLIGRQMAGELSVLLAKVSASRRMVSYVYPDASRTAKSGVTPEGVHSIPIVCPADISRRLGELFYA